MNARDKAIQILEDPKASKDAKELARMLLREPAAPVVVPQPYTPPIVPTYPVPTAPGPWDPWNPYRNPITWGTATGSGN